MKKLDKNVNYSRSCRNCSHFKQPAPRKWKKCENNILPCKQSWNYGCCLWWEKKKES